MVKYAHSQWAGYWLQPKVLAAAAVLLVLLLASYHSSVPVLLEQWLSPDYQYAFFVLPFCVYLLWLRRDLMPTEAPEGSWWGLVFLLIWALLRWASAAILFVLLDPFALVFFVAGFALLLGGWATLRWAWPAILFMFFMVPLPGRLAGMLAIHLQQIAASASTYVIQTLGIAAARTGTQVYLYGQEAPLDVEYACSGLRMMMLFFAICVGASFVMRQSPMWERIVIVASAVPIAILSNVFRISLTAVMYHMNLGELAHKFFHDFSGLLMMPFGMAILWGEITLLRLIVIEPTSPRRPVREEGYRGR
jgi:exosortase